MTSSTLIIGVDEVGRGCLAGPVVSAAVLLTDKLDNRIYDLLTDSKKINKKLRSELSKEICKSCLFSVGVSSVEEIDSINILQASLLSMKRAVQDLLLKYSLYDFEVWVDGNKKIPQVNWPQKTFIGGDLSQKPISAASIVAKVYRDNLMQEYALHYPGYDFEKNKGYGSKKHKQVIGELGYLPIHRKSFSPIKEMLFNESN